MNKKIQDQLKLLISGILIAFLSLNLLNACTPPSDRKPVKKTEAEKRKIKETLTKECKLKEHKDSKKCKDFLKEQADLKKKCKEKDNKDTKECKEFKKSKDVDDDLKSIPGMTKPKVDTDLKDDETTKEDLEVISDLLDYSHNKFEAAWKVARTADKNKKSSDLSDDSTDDEKTITVSSSETLGTTVFSFTRNLIDDKKVILKKEDGSITSKDTRYVVVKKKSDKQAEYIFYGSKKEDNESYDDIVSKGSKLMTVLHYIDEDTYQLFYKPEEAQTFVKTGLKIAQFGVDYDENNPPLCAIEWKSDEKGKSALECVNLAHDITTTTGYNFIKIIYNPSSSVTAKDDDDDDDDDKDVVYLAKYNKISLDSSTDSGTETGTTKVIKALENQVEVSDDGDISINKFENPELNGNEDVIDKKDQDRLDDLADKVDETLDKNDDDDKSGDTKPEVKDADTETETNTDKSNDEADTSDESTDSGSLDVSSVNEDTSLLTPNFEHDEHLR